MKLDSLETKSDDYLQQLLTERTRDRLYLRKALMEIANLLVAADFAEHLHSSERFMMELNEYLKEPHERQ